MTRWLLRAGLVLVLGVHFGGPSPAQEPLPPPSVQVPTVPPPAASPYAPYAPSANPYGPYGPIPSPPPTAYTGGSVITPIAPPVLMEIPEASAPVPNPTYGTLAR